jgi:predicted MPP superfamily phosphohydrolase
MTLTRLLTFLGIVTSVLFLVHLYVWFRVVRPAALPSPWGRIATIALFALCAAIPLMFMIRDSWPREVVTPISWIVYSWMGILFYLFVFALITDIGRLTAGLFGALPQDAERRNFLGRMIAGGIAGVAAVTGIGGILHARGFRIKTVEVALKNLPREASGYVIAQLTDVHIGPTIGRSYIEDVVRETNALGADMIVITGDLVDGSVEELREHAAPLAQLKARDGVWFVTGNHEYYSGADAWIEHIATLGIRTLRNERVDIRGVFDLAGIDDAKALGMAPGHGPDLTKALADRDLGKPVVLLAHQPKAFPEAILAGVDLQLSGHVHGGQIIPFNWLVKLEQPYLDGLHREGDSQIYVSPGTGYWGPPMRIGTTSEITRVVLTAG